MSIGNKKWELNDSFRVWREKYNNLLDEPLINLFSIDYNEASLSVDVEGGKIRKGRLLLDVLPKTLILNASEVNQYVVLQADPDFLNGTIEVYSDGTFPTEDTFNIIPLYLLDTNTSGVINFEDLRAILNFGGGGSGITEESKGVLKFEKNITEDTTITSTQNGLSVDPTVAQGVTVTVDQDSVWVIL